MDEDWEMNSEEDAFGGPDAYIEPDDYSDDQSEDNGPITLTSLYNLGHVFSVGSPSVNFILGPAPEFLHAFGARRRYRDEEDDDEYLYGKQCSSPKPKQAGRELLLSGDFGRVGGRSVSRSKRWNVAKLINHPHLRFRAAAYIEDISSNLVPNSNGTAVAMYDSNVYSGQFSADSSFYYTCAQDFRLRVYDMLAPPIRFVPTITRTRRRRNQNTDDGHESTMTVLKTIQGHEGRWTITDSHLSPDNQRIIYSSITSTVYMANTLDSSTTQTPIPFHDPHFRRGNIWSPDDSFGIWSCRFSADGNEVVAGGNRNIFVYDLLANRRTVSIVGHEDDVNSCCWADTESGNVLISGSDDSYVKVWDRRSLGMSQKPSGVLIGHTEGITYVSSKGDGRYIISNGKDQALRLWDLRKMRSSAEFDRVANKFYGTNFDYRYGRFPKARYAAHPQDCSVMTYRGHTVLRTLIRCHFSPSETTGAQYIYSGSANGKIHIWSLDGRIVQILDRTKSLPMSFDPSGPEPEQTKGRAIPPCVVRDVAWNSQEPMIMSAGWDDARGGSVVARHEWKGLSKLPGALEDWIEKERLERLELRVDRDEDEFARGFVTTSEEED